MKDLIQYVVTEIVAHPEAVEVTETTGQDGRIFEVRVDPADVGKVIGRNGKTANALRVLVKAAASKKHGRASVEILADD